MKRGLILSTLILLILGGCGNPLTDFAVFNAYRGVNLMAGVEFQIDPINGWEESSFAGILFLETTDLGNVGPNLVEPEPAIRLESLNQLVDGHFPSGLPILWDSAPIAPGTPMTVDDLSPGIQFVRTSQEQFISTDLLDPTHLLTFDNSELQQFRANIRFQMDFALPDARFFGLVQRDLDLTNVLYAEDTPNLIARDFPMNQTHLLSVSGIVPQADLERIVVGGELNRETTIYSIRILEDDPSRYYIQTVLTKVPTTDGLPLPEQGRFEFSFSARKHSALGPNRFHADFVTVELAGVNNAGIIYRTESTSVDVSSAQTDTDPDPNWTRYTISIPNPLGTELRLLQDNDDALIIRIYPFRSGVVDAGSIELSNPELYFFPQ